MEKNQQVGNCGKRKIYQFDMIGLDKDKLETSLKTEKWHKKQREDTEPIQIFYLVSEVVNPFYHHRTLPLCYHFIILDA